MPDYLGQQEILSFTLDFFLEAVTYILFESISVNKRMWHFGSKGRWIV